MTNEIGFMAYDIMGLFRHYDVSVLQNGWVWDRQTIVMIFDNETELNGVRDILRRNRKPNSMYQGINHSIDGFVNLNYKPSERDPAKRNVRIVYCNKQRIEYEEISRRFQCSYIMRVRRKEVNIDGTPRIGREIFEIPSGKGYAREI